MLRLALKGGLDFELARGGHDEKTSWDRIPRDTSGAGATRQTRAASFSAKSCNQGRIDMDPKPQSCSRKTQSPETQTKALDPVPTLVAAEYTGDLGRAHKRHGCAVVLASSCVLGVVVGAGST